MSLVIQIVSPHLDDAALSCADHIRVWQQLGHRVAIVTLFTEFGVDPPSEYMRRFMVEQGFASVVDYGGARWAEDLKAMAQMNVTSRHAGLVDGGFRRCDDGAVRGDFGSLTQGEIDDKELPLMDQVKLELNALSTPDLAVLPLGVGRHVDHLIAREAGRAVWSDRCAVGFYGDIPYMRNPLHHSPATFRLARGLRPSIIRITNWKRALLDNYRTQMPYLFCGRPRFPEILLLPRGVGRRLAGVE